MAAIGIDLGTTYSCVAMWQGGQVHIIPDDQGNRTIPSYVSFKGNNCLVGDVAKKQVVVNPCNTVFDAKRLIGRKFNELQVQEDIKHWPFQVADGADGKPKIVVQYFNELREFYPEQISSMILSELKESSEKFIGEKIVNAVITVPAYFNDAQRKATIDAGKIAGLNVLRIINEPTAAALAYGLYKKLDGEKTVMIYDLGGGTTDVTILTIGKGPTFDVKSTSGDLHLGGEDFDLKLVDYLCQEFEKENGKNPKNDKKSLRKLRVAAVNAKQELSSSTESTVMIDALMDGIDFNIDVSRAQFENICFGLFKDALKPVERALADAKIDKMTIDDVVLVGGSTKIPKIRSILQNFFCGKELNMTINAHEAIAYGAAVQAAMLTNEKNESLVLQGVQLFDVTPLSLGTSCGFDHQMSTIINRNTKIPCKRSLTYYTLHDNQKKVAIDVFEGENPITIDNNFLGKFILSGLTPAPAGKAKFEVTFELNVDGILHVTARDEYNGRRKSMEISYNEGKLSEQEIENMLEEVGIKKNYDKEKDEELLAKHKLETYILNIKSSLQDSSCELNDDNKNEATIICDDTVEWLKEKHIKKDYLDKLQDVTTKLTFIMSNNKRNINMIYDSPVKQQPKRKYTKKPKL
ncbi:heat shock 70 kDa protein-like [Aphidius gifuensis]|uniref:heat shock 70 kDa protein-like n=1 Tax=Aphidius gifuensis TaxID=684658 RepID=UPI001CDC416F|nr:heat shock 70 kDa protein-like [Aphidius gifuensis]